MKRFFSALLFAITLTSTAFSASFPSPRGFVNDFAQVLDTRTEARLESIAAALNQKTGIEVVTVTVPSLEGLPVTDYAVSLFEKWKIGKKGKDNGVLILVAPVEKKVRIEVGYGLEPVLSDGKSGEILDHYMIPFFEEGSFSKGIEVGQILIVKHLAKAYGVPFSELPISGKDETRAPSKIPFLFIILMLFLLFGGHRLGLLPWLFFFLPRSGFDDRFGGFGGSGFGGFGGGGSGGGGADRGW